MTLATRITEALARSIELIDDLRAEKVAEDNMEAAAQLACKIDGIQIARGIVLDVVREWEAKR